MKSLSRKILALTPRALLGLALGLATGASAKVVHVTGSVALESRPFPAPSDSLIRVFDEQQNVPFVCSQPLDFGSIAPGTLVNSHYLLFDPVALTGQVGSGTVTFDGPIVGLITSGGYLTADLRPEASGTSDSYFGLESVLGPYPAGAAGTERYRGLGDSSLDDFTYTPGSDTLVINSLNTVLGGAVDGMRILTFPVPEPATAVMAGVCAVLLVILRRRGDFPNGG